MERYLNLSGISPITYYQIEDDRITVWFEGTLRTYTYSYRKAGRRHVEAMKKLARSGAGLSTYISRNVRKLYD